MSHSHLSNLFSESWTSTKACNGSPFPQTSVPIKLQICLSQSLPMQPPLFLKITTMTSLPSRLTSIAPFRLAPTPQLAPLPYSTGFQIPTYLQVICLHPYASSTSVLQFGHLCHPFSTAASKQSVKSLSSGQSSPSSWASLLQAAQVFC